MCVCACVFVEEVNTGTVVERPHDGKFGVQVCFLHLAKRGLVVAMAFLES